MTNRVSDHTTLASLISSGQMSYDTVFSSLADGNLNALIYEVIGEYGYDGEYLDLEYVIQKKLMFYKIKHEFIQQCVVRHLRMRAEKNCEYEDKDFRFELNIVRDVILEPHIQKTDLSTGKIYFPRDRFFYVINKSAIRREDGFDEIEISPSNIWFSKSEVAKSQEITRRERLLTRVMEEKDKKNKAFFATVAKEEGISPQRLDQILKGK